MQGYGLTVFSAGRGKDRFRRAGELARAAEGAGFGAVWTGELYNRSATIPMVRHKPQFTAVRRAM